MYILKESEICLGFGDLRRFAKPFQPSYNLTSRDSVQMVYD